MRVIGLISGTSVDGIDAAAVEIGETAGGDTLTLRTLAFEEFPIPPALRRRVFGLFDPERSRVPELCQVNFALGEAFAEAANALAARLDAPPDLIASHGQTVWHEVTPGNVLSTLQIAEPSVIAERTGSTVVADFRPRDMAAGGQGAPLASYVDALLFADPHRDRAAQNIGGIGNVTFVPALDRDGEPIAFDTGPGNALIDRAAEVVSGGALRCDLDGRLAAAGTPNEVLLAELLSDPYYAAPPPKSTGREWFGAAYADAALAKARSRGLTDADAVATLTALTARSIADAYRRFLPRLPDAVVLGGGGGKNPTLRRMLADALPNVECLDHEAVGLSSAGREAIYFAILGYQTLHGRPNTVPSCTGATHATVMGKLIPGANYRSLLQRVARTPETTIRRLRVE